MLVTSSEKSWIREKPFNISPMQQWRVEDDDFEGKQNLVAIISGQLKAAFDQDKDSNVPNNSDDPVISFRAETNDARVVVIGGSALLRDQYTSESNQVFILNLLDWMLLDDAMLSIRTRGLTVAPLDEVSDTTRNVLKYGNMLGLPVLLVMFGLIRWRIRETRRHGLVL